MSLVRRWSAASVGSLLLGLLALNTLGPRGVEAEAVPPADGIYRLTNACGGLVLDVKGAGLRDSAPVVLSRSADAAHQQWRLSGVGAGRFRLSALHSGKLLDVSQAGQQGAPVIQYRATGGANQDWLIRSAGSGQVFLMPSHAPGLRLEVRGAAEVAGASVQVGQAQEGCAQRWKLQAVAVPVRTPQLAVSPDGRSLMQADGSPFVYLADTAWEIAHRLSRAEVVRYLDTRRAQGFTAVQLVALAELDGISVPNAHGDLPLQGRDPSRPATTPGARPGNAVEYDYWDHLDYVFGQAAARGLTVTLLPTWGRWVNDEPLFTPASARAYGEFLGRRYWDQRVIWLLGGDRPADTEARQVIWRAMAVGLETGMGGPEAALIGYHPDAARTSAEWFHKESWLDFHTWQSGHCRERRPWAMIGQTLALRPAKPVLNAEPIYENHPVCFDAAGQGYSDATDVRNAAYWSVFAGAFGHAYGHHSVWQLWEGDRRGINGPRESWQDALDAPGARQMRHLRTLLEARPPLGRVPDDNLVTQVYDGPQRIQAMRGPGYAFVYTAAGQSVRVRGERLPGDRTVASWYNPRIGQTHPIRTVTQSGDLTFKAPSQGRGHDWVLVLDDVARNFPLPITPP